jgi:hypothetical protein
LRSDVVEKTLGDDEPNTIWRTTTAWVITVILQAKTVIECKLLPCPDIPAGDQPDVIVIELGFAIRRATVVQIARGIPRNIAINVQAVVKRENVNVVLLAKADRF